MAHGAPSLSPQMSPSRSLCESSGKDPVRERMLQRRAKASVSETRGLGTGFPARPCGSPRCPPWRQGRRCWEGTLGRDAALGLTLGLAVPSHIPLAKETLFQAAAVTSPGAAAAPRAAAGQRSAPVRGPRPPRARGAPCSPGAGGGEAGWEVQRCWGGRAALCPREQQSTQHPDPPATGCTLGQRHLCDASDQAKSWERGSKSCVGREPSAFGSSLSPLPRASCGGPCRQAARSAAAPSEPETRWRHRGAPLPPRAGGCKGLEGARLRSSWQGPAQAGVSTCPGAGTTHG